MTTLLITLFTLVLTSAFFSGSETGMMAINRYKVRHLAKDGHKRAHEVINQLKTPEKFLGAILIGNTFCNVLASALATFLAVKHFGELGVVLAPIILTLVILIVAEVTPKTIAALYPERVAFIAIYPLKVALWLLYPFVLIVNAISKVFMMLMRIKRKKPSDLALSQEELRTVVNEASALIPQKNKTMLLRVLDLKHITVNDVMVPRQEIAGIDLNDEWSTIEQQLQSSQHSRLALFEDSVNELKGVLHLRQMINVLKDGKLSPEKLIAFAREPYFIPEDTPLSTQLLKFQQTKNKLAFVVDEYGDLQGLVTLDDIVEEIVGEFNPDFTEIDSDIHPQPDNSYLIDGSANIRELNRTLGWSLPQDGPKTLSGAIVEYLESIPLPRTCIKLNGYPIEIIKVKDKMVKTAKVFPTNADH